MRIDSHQHFWNYDPVRDSWIDDSMNVIRKDFLPEDLKPILKANKMDGCVAVQADQSEEETNFLLQCAAENPFVKGVVGWVDLCDVNILERLQFYSKYNLFKGVRHIVQSEKEGFLLREDFKNGISHLNTFNLVYDILVYPHQLENVLKLVTQFPNQQFVIDHIAKPQISNGLNEKWTNNMVRLAAFTNVACKISGLVTETTNFKWSVDMFTPFLDVVVKTFGVHRLLFGSDWPVCLLASEYSSVLHTVESYFVDFSEEEKQLIMGQNATRIYNL